MAGMNRFASNTPQRTPNPALDPYREQLQKLRARMNNPKYQDRIPVIQYRINQIRKQAGVAPRDFSGWKPKYQTTPTPTPPPTSDLTPIVQQEIEQKNIDKLQPAPVVTPPAVEPNPKDYAGSPLYQWQQRMAQQALDRQLSARGLYDSGAALQANQDMQQQLMANEVGRMQHVAEWQQQVAAANADRSQANAIANANRWWDILASEAARKDTLGQNRTTNQLALISMLLGENPMKYVSGAITDSAQLKAQLAKYASEYMSQMYPQLFQYLPELIPDFYATGDTGGGSMASQAGAQNNA